MMFIPEARRDNRECLYVTETVRRRFAGLKADISARGETIRSVSAAICVHPMRLYQSCNGISYLYLDSYLKLGEFMKWDLRRDVNYIYANVIYQPDELILRLRHIGIRTYRELTHRIGYGTRDMISGSVKYSRKRTLQCFGAILYYISSEEHKAGYPDAIELED